MSGICAPTAILPIVVLMPATTSACFRPPPAPIVSNSAAIGGRLLRRIPPTRSRAMPRDQPSTTTANSTVRPSAISGSPRKFSVSKSNVSGLSSSFATVRLSIRMTGSRIVIREIAKLGGSVPF